MKFGRRHQVAQAIADGHDTVAAIMSHLGITLSSCRNVLSLLLKQKAITRSGCNRYQPAVYSLLVPLESLDEPVQQQPLYSAELETYWPIGIPFPPVVAVARKIVGEASHADAELSRIEWIEERAAILEFEVPGMTPGAC